MSFIRGRDLDISDPDNAELLYIFCLRSPYAQAIENLCALRYLSFAECVDLYFRKEFNQYYDSGMLV